MPDFQHTISIIKEYFLFKIQSKSSAGHGIHSPMVYDFARKVIKPRKTSIQVDEVEWYRLWQIESPIEIRPSDFGAGSRLKIKPKKLGTIIKTSSVSPKTGRLLFRLAKWSHAKEILELGTSVGVSAMYLASANPNASVITLEGDKQRATLAQNSFEFFGLNNIQIIEGDFDLSLNEAFDKLEHLDLVFFDGNHKAEPTLRYFKQCLRKARENSVFVFDDIRWNSEMYTAWKVIAQHQSVTISIDLFNIGIVFFRKGISKQHFKINF